MKDRIKETYTDLMDALVPTEAAETGSLKATQEAVKLVARLARKAEKRNPGEGGAEFIASMAVKMARAADISVADVQKMFG